MKRITALLIAALMMFTLVSCGGGKSPKTSNNAVEVTSDVELLDFAENRIAYLFAPEDFEFDEISAEGGYNSGRNHILEIPGEDYEIEVGLIAAPDSILYDLFLNGTLTKTVYNGMEFDSDDVYELTVKEELDFEFDGHKVYYVERTINDGYPSNYVLFEHIDEDDMAGLYGVELYSDNTDFYTRENCIEMFKEVFGIGRTESADYFEDEEDTDDEDEEDTYGTLESIDMVYGSDELPVTIYKPSNGTLEHDVDEADIGLDYVWISSDDFDWNIDVFGAVNYDQDAASYGFVDYYYKGELHRNDNDYDAFEEEIYQLDIEYMGQPVMVIKYTFTEAGEDYEDTEYFVGVEFEDTYNGERYGDGLLGFRYYMYDEEPSFVELASLFGEIFGEEYEFLDEEEVEDWDDDDEGFDTDLIVGEWNAVDSPVGEVFFFYDGDYATYTAQGSEMELDYYLTDEGFLSLIFETGQELYYTVSFDGSDTMYLEDDAGNQVEFERI